MKDVVSLTESGGTLGFPIQSSILEELKLKNGDLIETEIFREYQEQPSFVIIRPLRKIGSSLGITIRKYIVDELGLKKTDNIQVDIRKP